MTIGKDENNINYTLKDQKLQKVMEEKDIVVTIDDQLEFESHIYCDIGQTCIGQDVKMTYSPE